MKRLAATSLLLAGLMTGSIAFAQEEDQAAESLPDCALVGAVQSADMAAIELHRGEGEGFSAVVRMVFVLDPDDLALTNATMNEKQGIGAGMVLRYVYTLDAEGNVIAGESLSSHLEGLTFNLADTGEEMRVASVSGGDVEKQLTFDTVSDNGVARFSLGGAAAAQVLDALPSVTQEDGEADGPGLLFSAHTTMVTEDSPRAEARIHPGAIDVIVGRLTKNTRRLVTRQAAGQCAAL